MNFCNLGQVFGHFVQTCNVFVQGTGMTERGLCSFWFDDLFNFSFRERPALDGFYLLYPFRIILQGFSPPDYRGGLASIHVV